MAYYKHIMYTFNAILSIVKFEVKMAKVQEHARATVSLAVGQSCGPTYVIPQYREEQIWRSLHGPPVTLTLSRRDNERQFASRNSFATSIECRGLSKLPFDMLWRIFLHTVCLPHPRDQCSTMCSPVFRNHSISSSSLPQCSDYTLRTIEHLNVCTH